MALGLLLVGVIGACSLTSRREIWACRAHREWNISSVTIWEMQQSFAREVGGLPWDILKNEPYLCEKTYRDMRRDPVCLLDRLEPLPEPPKPGWWDRGTSRLNKKLL